MEGGTRQNGASRSTYNAVTGRPIGPDPAILDMEVPVGGTSVATMGADESWYFSKEANAAKKGKQIELNKFVRKELFPR